jgi:hypothetical protein
MRGLLSIIAIRHLPFAIRCIIPDFLAACTLAEEAVLV